MTPGLEKIFQDPLSFKQRNWAVADKGGLGAIGDILKNRQREHRRLNEANPC